MDFMVAVTAAVRRGAPSVCPAADMPFLSYQVGIKEEVKNAGRFVAEVVEIITKRSEVPVIDCGSGSGLRMIFLGWYRGQVLSLQRVTVIRLMYKSCNHKKVSRCETLLQPQPTIRLVCMLESAFASGR
jgi:ketopantoate hydroxymethyltransferase